MNHFKIVILVAGFFALFGGILFLFFPRFLLRASDISNKFFEVDSRVLQYRIGVGICFFLCSLFMGFMAYYFSKLGIG